MGPWCLGLQGWGCQKSIWRVWGLANGRLERQEKAIDGALVPWPAGLGLNAKKKLLMGPWCLGLRGWGCQKGIWRVWGLANGRLERQEKAIDLRGWGYQKGVWRVCKVWRKEPSSTPPVVPGAAPALAKAGVGGLSCFSVTNLQWRGPGRCALDPPGGHLWVPTAPVDSRWQLGVWPLGRKQDMGIKNAGACGYITGVHTDNIYIYIILYVYIYIYRCVCVWNYITIFDHIYTILYITLSLYIYIYVQPTKTPSTSS